MAPKKTPQYVVVRTYSAGVHVGELVESAGKEVQLANARRIWNWQKRFTLHEVATAGVGEGSKVSVAVPGILLTEAIEVITCSADGAKLLREAKAYSP